MLIFKEKKNQHLSRVLKNGYYIHTSLGLDEEKRKHFSEKKHKKKQEKNKKGMYETHYALYFRRRACISYYFMSKQWIFIHSGFSFLPFIAKILKKVFFFQTNSFSLLTQLTY